MQDSKLQNKKKLIMQKAIGKVIRQQRIAMGKGINTFYFEYDLGNAVITDTENGKTKPKIGTIWKFANAFGMKCSELVKLIEDELPENFNFYDD